MLTKKQNMLEVIKGGNPDRFVKQYEAVQFIMNTPYQTKYPMMPAGPGAEPVQCGWGYYNSWPAGMPGAMPMHDPAHLVCPDVADWRKYVKAPFIDFPEEDWAPAKAAYDAIDHDEYFGAVFVAPGLFEMTHYLCSIEEALTNFYVEPEAVHDLIEYVTDWEVHYAELICRYIRPDALFHHDDWGTQRSSFLSPEMFREFFLEPYRRVYKAYRDGGVELIIHHNDSYSANLVPSMIEMGVDVWQGCMSVNDLPKLVKEYGKDITFMGGIDNGIVDRHDWTRELINGEVDRQCEQCGKHFYIPCTTHGLNFATYPGVYEAVDDEIDAMTKKFF